VAPQLGSRELRKSFVRLAVALATNSRLLPAGGGAYERWGWELLVWKMLSGSYAAFDLAQPRPGWRAGMPSRGPVASPWVSKTEIHSVAAEFGPGSCFGVGAAGFVDGRGQGEVLGAVGVGGGVGGPWRLPAAPTERIWKHVDIAVSEAGDQWWSRCVRRGALAARSGTAHVCLPVMLPRGPGRMTAA